MQHRERVAEPVGLRRVARKAAAEAVPSSVAARAPFRAPAPGVARRVPPEASERQAQGLRPAARHEALRLVAAVLARSDVAAAGAVAQPDAAAAEVVAEPDVVGAAALPVVPAEFPSEPPWAAAWVSRPDPVPPSAPPRSAPTARAMELSPIAWLSELSWQAALVVELSCALGPGEF